MAVISNAVGAIYASGGHDGRSCASRSSAAAVPLVVLSAGYLPTYLPEPESTADGRVLRIVRERVYACAPVFTVIPPRYWWCVALFIAASPLSRRREPLHTNRSLVRRKRGGSPPLSSLSLSLSLSVRYFALPATIDYAKTPGRESPWVDARVRGKISVSTEARIYERF